MASQQLTDQLVKHIDEALAMEQNVLRMLDGMIQTTETTEPQGRRAMAKKIEASWDKFAGMALHQAGVPV